MDLLEVVPGREIGKLHVLEKTGKLDGEDLYICRDERGRNIQFVESDIIAQAGEAPEVVEEEVVEEEVVEEEASPSADEAQSDEKTPPNGESEEEVQSKGESADETVVKADQEIAGKGQEDNLDSLMDKPINDLEAQEIVAILIGKYGDNPPDNLTVSGLRKRLGKAKKAQEAKSNEKKKKGGK